MTEVKYYCSGCGLKMKPKKVDFSFDRINGKPYWNLIWECKNWRWWNPSKHTRFKSDKHGNTYAFEI